MSISHSKRFKSLSSAFRLSIPMIFGALWKNTKQILDKKVQKKCFRLIVNGCTHSAQVVKDVI